MKRLPVAAVLVFAVGAPLAACAVIYIGQAPALQQLDITQAVETSASGPLRGQRVASAPGP